MTSELRHTDYTFCKPKCVNLIPFTFCEEFPKWIFPCPQPVNLMAINHSTMSANIVVPSTAEELCCLGIDFEPDYSFQRN